MSTQPVTAAKNPSSQPDIDATGEAISSLTPELVIALCGPIGSPLHETAKQIKYTLSEFDYQTETVRLSDLIRLNAGKTATTIDQTSKFREIQSLIKAGDKLRNQYGRDILAKLAIAKISGDREHRYGTFADVANESNQAEKAKIRNQRICHIIDSVKNSGELQLLRLIYGDALFAIGTFSPLEIRIQNLEQPGKLSLEEIKELIDTDSGEEAVYGQSVRETFPLCDFFLRVDYPITQLHEPKAIGQIAERLRRFFDLVFRTVVITPTSEEMAMYAATSAARNSACLSRQVGAAVMGSNGELLAVGWNDVPRSGGGLYGMNPPPAKQPKEGEILDQRCFARVGSRCSNDKEKRAIAQIVAESLARGGALKSEDVERAAQIIIEDTRVKDLIEFSRAVHAEMHAILTASRVAGDRVLGGKIFVTTYPCHSCARHLVAAGISEIHYIEPYRKSLATRLHDDTLTESANPQNKVQVIQYDGIAPRRFIEMFDGGPRKKHGVLALSGRIEAAPLTQVSLKAIPRLEEVVVAEVETKDLQLPNLLTNEDSDEKSDSQAKQLPLRLLTEISKQTDSASSKQTSPQKQTHNITTRLASPASESDMSVYRRIAGNYFQSLRKG